MKATENTVDVIVVGAGPVGLLTAIELTLAGASVLVLERLAAPSRVNKALATGPLGIETLLRRGMTAAVDAAEERSLAAMNAFIEQSGGGEPRGRGGKFSGHFAGLMIRKAAQNEPDRHSRPVDQQAVEAMLSGRARSLGIEVRRECDVTGFDEQADGIQVTWASPAGPGSLHCAYLVGCDGGRSSIRKMAGFEFHGTPPTMTMYSAVARFDHPERLAPAGWRHTPEGVFFYGPFPKLLGMLDFTGPPADRDAPVTREEVETALRRISGADVRITVLESAGRWTDNTRLVDSYRRGRVFLAGDAAHIHSPFGGQGMSLGLCDAANLGWKLAAVIRGRMPESLLDTYSAERRAVAQDVLANTLAQAAILRPDPQSAALREILAKLMRFDDVSLFFGEMIGGLSNRYDLGSGREEVGRLTGDRQIGLGRIDATLYDLMRDGSGVFLDASADGQPSQLVAAAAPAIRRA
ncbi:MAG: monooxygenase FAD-binding, partial [Akkermansiaceae bacterium]|nr:monooxygenase FAD-binding [Akkermansiaceae bacterium]